MIKQLSKIEIINETVEYYTNNTRAIISFNDCVYKTEDGNMCAHSRCLTDEVRNSIGINRPFGSAEDVISDFGGDDVHQEQYRGHEPEFWNKIQHVHDNCEFWNKTETGNELTEEGNVFVNFLKEIYGK